MTLSVQHQVDDLFEPFVIPGGGDSAQQYFDVVSRRAPNPREIDIETGLEEAPRVQVKLTSARTPAIVEPLGRVIDRLRELRALQPGWDSYAAKPLARTTIRPSLELALTALHRCAEPRFDASSTGGAILIWEVGEQALEVTVRPDGAYDLFMSLDDAEEERDGASLQEAQCYLARFCAR